MTRLLFPFITAFLLGYAPAAVASESAGERDPAQNEFFENVRKLCGSTFEGVTEFPPDPDHDFAGKKLVMHIATCTDQEIRMPFRVGEDTSRTWILTLRDEGLLLKHDHRHADGTPDEITMYGGWATNEGTATEQQFPADEDTAKLLPEAATNVWTLTLDLENGTFRYALTRHGKPRYSAVLKRAQGQE